MEKITPQIILASQPNVEEAMKEYAGIKIVEAIELVTRDLTAEQKEKIMANIDEIIDKVL